VKPANHMKPKKTININKQIIIVITLYHKINI